VQCDPEMAGATPSQGVTDGPRQLIAGPTSFALSVGGRQSSIVDKWRQNFTVEVFFSDSRWSDTSIAAYATSTGRSTGWLVILAIQLKYPAMVARSLALTLLFLLCVTAAGWAAEPAPAPVVLQSPPSMAPGSVKGLIRSRCQGPSGQPRLPPILPTRPRRL